MTPKHLYLLLIALVAIGASADQNEDELLIPVENDNQFPPDKHSDTIDGSGDGVLEEPGDTDGTTTEAVVLPIEQVQTKILLEETESTTSEGDDLCPKPCVCRIEGNDFIVDCSGYSLTEFPAHINEKATKLYIQQNKLTEIPKQISDLKKLQVLNASDNLITNLVPGSVSELPELITLNLRNNRFIEYPHDLKNSFGLIKLREINLAGNDMRTELTSEMFVKFEALTSIILPSSRSELPQELCKNLPKTLEKVCIESCEKQEVECERDELKFDDNDDGVLPGMIPYETKDDVGIVNTPVEGTKIDNNVEITTLQGDLATEANTNTTSEEFSFRSAVNKHSSDIAVHSSIAEAPKETSTPGAPIKVGATTSDTKTGGVDKSIIGLVVAGMVVIVAGITIKKNWSSIKKRFSSNSRTPIERNGTNANSTSPEEVPLQDKDKSPV